MKKHEGPVPDTVSRIPACPIPTSTEPTFQEPEREHIAALDRALITAYGPGHAEARVTAPPCAPI